MLFYKAIVYRLLRLLVLAMSVLFISGSIDITISVVILDAIVATLFYYYFDVTWEQFTKGKSYGNLSRQ